MTVHPPPTAVYAAPAAVPVASYQPQPMYASAYPSPVSPHYSSAPAMPAYYAPPSPVAYHPPPPSPVAYHPAPAAMAYSPAPVHSVAPIPVATVPSAGCVHPAPAAPVAVHAVTSHEQWTLVPCWGGKVAIQSCTGSHLRADKHHPNVVNLVPHCRGWEKWTIHESGHNQVSFCSKWGTWLSSLPCGGVRQATCRGPAEIWTRVPLAGGKFAFLSAHQKFLRAT